MFSQGSYLKVWEITNKTDKYIDAQCSTNRKIAEGQFEKDFGGFVRFVGHAYNTMKNDEAGGSYKILSCGVRNTYDKEKKVTYNNFIVFDVEPSQNNNNSTAGASQPDNNFVSVPEGLEDELPFK